jgi:hypothetical protein
MPDIIPKSALILLVDSVDGADEVYPDWVVQRKAVMRKAGCLDVVLRVPVEHDTVTGVFGGGEARDPEPSTGRNSKTWKLWKQRNDAACSAIIEALGRDQYAIIRGLEDQALEMWEALEKYHMVTGLGSLVAIYKKLMSLSKEQDTGVGTHIKGVLRLTDTLKHYGEPISDAFIVACIFRSLPPSFNQLIVTLDADPNVGDVSYVTSRLINFEKTYSVDSTPAASSSSGRDLATGLHAAARSGYTPRPLSEKTCFNCGERGHIASMCKAPRRQDQSQGDQKPVASLAVAAPLYNF